MKDVVVSLSPNPAKDRIIFSFSDQLTGDKPTIIRLYDAAGKLMQEERFTNVQGTTLVNVSKFVSGMYLVQVISNNSVVHTQKLIKE